MVERLNRLSLKNKILFSTLAVILPLSVGIALLARGLLISSLVSGLESRGLGIAQSTAERGKNYILAEDKPQLTTLVFDAAQLKERKALIHYIFILDKNGGLLAHTFTDIFPEKLLNSNRVPAEQAHSVRLLRVDEEWTHDVALPVKEGVHKIGTVHVGLKKHYIDGPIEKLEITLLGFIAAMALVSFGISHWLVRDITRPLKRLIRMTNEIGRGNLDVIPGSGTEARCRELKNCDEISHLANSFSHMTRRLKASQERLRESEEKYRSLSESGPNPVFVIDRESLEILDANPSAEQTYGYTREELLGRPFTDLGIFRYGEADLGAPAATGTPKECLVADKVLHFKRGNRPFYVNARACPIRYEDREAFILATTDITELIEKDAQLIQAGQMGGLGEMSADIAHELNQPLNAIKVGNEFLKMMIEEGKEIQERDLSRVIAEVGRQVDRAAEIINRLGNFGRKVE